MKYKYKRNLECFIGFIAIVSFTWLAIIMFWWPTTKEDNKQIKIKTEVKCSK